MVLVKIGLLDGLWTDDSNVSIKSKQNSYFNTERIKKAPGIDGSQGGEGLRKVSGSDWTVTTAASVPTLLKSSLVQVVTGYPFQSLTSVPVSWAGLFDGSEHHNSLTNNSWQPLEVERCLFRNTLPFK